MMANQLPAHVDDAQRQAVRGALKELLQERHCSSGDADKVVQDLSPDALNKLYLGEYTTARRLHYATEADLQRCGLSPAAVSTLRPHLFPGHGDRAKDVVVTVVLKYKGSLDVTRRASKFAYGVLCKAVEGKWPDLAKVDYELSFEGASIEDDNNLKESLEAVIAANQQKPPTKQDEAPTAVIMVTNKCKGFTEFKMEEALAYLGCAQGGVPVNNAAFDAPQLTEQEREILLHAAREIHCRIPIFGPFHEGAEYTNREFIGPVLLCAARIVSGVALRAEYQLKGTLGNGPADYAAMYKDLAIAIAEAKHCKVEEAVPQNLAQAAASREQYINSLQPVQKGPSCGTKRKAYEVDILQRVPTSGIVTTGLHYIFMRYEQYPTPRVFKSDEYFLPLDSQKTTEALVGCLEPVVQRIVGILRLQKDAVDSHLQGKQACLSISAGVR